MNFRLRISEDMGVGNIGFVLGALMTLGTALGCKCTPAVLPMPSEMKPAETKPKWIDVNSVVFIGRVTETGPSLHSIRNYMKARLSRKDFEAMEQSESASLPEMKRLGLRLLPKKLHSRLKKARSEEEIEALYSEFFGLNEEGRRPVQFAVEETLEGEKRSRREV